MVTVIMLRMILYAPILGVGGIIKVVGTGAGMGWVIVMAVAVIIAFVMLLMVIAMPKFKLMQKLYWSYLQHILLEDYLLVEHLSHVC